jgi:predicted XRE-type DNA-binding protein
MKRKIECERSSGNVFADIGLANPEEALAKAEIARQINQIIAQRELTQSQAGDILGVDQPRVSALSKGRLSLFSLEKMMQFASKLGNEVEITIKPSPHSGIKVVNLAKPSEFEVPEQYVLSNAVIGGQNIKLVLMNRTYRRQPAMKIDKSGMQPIFDGGDLLVA